MAESVTPKLIDTTDAPLRFAVATPAVSRSPVLRLLHSISRRLACGAMAWAHSTSSAVSSAPLPVAVVVGSVLLPSCPTTVRLGGAGRPNWASNVARSDWIDGRLSESMIAIVWPAPWFAIWSTP